MTTTYDPHRSYQGNLDARTSMSICFNTTDEALVNWVRALEHTICQKLIEEKVVLSSSPFTENSLANCWHSTLKENAYGGYTLNCKWMTQAQDPRVCKVIRCYSLPNGSVFLEQGFCTDVCQGQRVVPVIRIRNVWYANGRCGLRLELVKVQIQDYREEGSNHLTLDFWDGPPVEDQRSLKRARVEQLAVP